MNILGCLDAASVGSYELDGRSVATLNRDELALLLAEAGFRDIDVRYLRSRRWRTGWSRVRSLGTAVRNAVPSLRKSLIAFAVK